jgi:shikimate dehydrogenase
VKQYGIIGYPLGHSFSKQYFTDKFSKEGLTNCVYNTFSIADINELATVFANNKNLHGLNVTIPYKVSVISYLTDTTHLPNGLQACNCIKIVGTHKIGFNTDVVGFEKSLQPLLQSQHTQALILGNGGAAQAVKFVLQQLHIPFKTVGRSTSNNTDYTYQTLTPSLIEQHTLIINTTPVGTFPNVNDCPVIPYDVITDKHLLYDLVYNPSKTLFLQKGEQQGAMVKNGYEMLVLQAKENWRIWNE